MRVVRHRLEVDGTPCPFRQSPNRGGRLDPKYMIMHYTAGSSAEGAISALTNKAHKASAHLVIGRDGAITQLVPFDRVAWHAGRSRWLGLEGLNQHSIGIELDNAGALENQGGAWRAWFGRAYPDDEVMVAAHKHEDVERGWHLFPEAQITAAVEAARAIVDRYELLDVLGHDDIAPGRKRDPGPAFPMDSFEASVMGRRENSFPDYVTTANLNIREGPGTDFERLEGSPLAPGTRLRLQSRDCNWCFVEVANSQGSPDLTGWVYGDYIRPA